MKRKKWGIGFEETNRFWVRTPWFALHLSAGGWDYVSNHQWWGFELRWGGDWNAPPGQYPYEHCRCHVLRRTEFGCEF